MKAKVVKCFDELNPEYLLWTIVIQVEKGGEFNLPLKGVGDKIFATSYKAEAVARAKRLNNNWGRGSQETQYDI